MDCGRFEKKLTPPKLTIWRAAAVWSWWGAFTASHIEMWVWKCAPVARVVTATKTSTSTLLRANQNLWTIKWKRKLPIDFSLLLFFSCQFRTVGAYAWLRRSRRVLWVGHQLEIFLGKFRFFYNDLIVHFSVSNFFNVARRGAREVGWVQPLGNNCFVFPSI